MSNTKILVWDAPLRVFHWLLAVSFVGAFVTADSERSRDVHVLFGYVMFGLILFRLLWGFAGTRYARFRAFTFGPGRVLGYLSSLFKRAPEHFAGHNPAGSWAIFALLSLGFLASLSGWLTIEDIGGEALAEWHDRIADAMLGVVLIHLVGVIVSSLLHRENLILSMITGYKSGAPGQGITRAHWFTALGLVVLVALGWAMGR